MSIKKYINYTNLGIFATAFAPSMSSAQENFNTIHSSNYKAIRSNFSNYDVTDKYNLYGYKQVVDKQLFQIKYGMYGFETKNQHLANKFRIHIEKIREIQDRANWSQLMKDATKFGLDIAQMTNQANFSLTELEKLIVNYIHALPHPDTKELLTSIGELRKMWLEVSGWR